MADVVADGLVLELLAATELRKSHDRPDQHVIVGGMLQAVVVAVQSQSHHPEHQNVPEIHPGPPGVLLVPDDLLFEQRKYLLVDFRGRENPLQPGEDGRKLIAALGGNGNLLDRSLTKTNLSVESFAHIKSVGPTNR